MGPTDFADLADVTDLSVNGTPPSRFSGVPTTSKSDQVVGAEALIRSHQYETLHGAIRSISAIRSIRRFPSCVELATGVPIGITERENRKRTAEERHEEGSPPVR